MEKSRTTVDVASLASSYTGAIDDLVEKNSTWWYSVEGEIDDGFGTAVENSLVAAGRLIENTATSSAASTKDIDKFRTSLQAVDRAAKILFDYYQKKRAKKDMEITSNFQAIAKKYLEGLSGKLDTSSTTPLKNFWILRLNGNHWTFEDLRESDALYFHCRRSNGPAQDYELFKRVREHDEGLAYSYGKHNAIVFKYEVTNAMHNDTQLGEIISFRITQKLPVSIPRTFLADKINFTTALESGEPVKLFELSESQFRAILVDVPSSPQTNGEVIFADASIPNLFADIATGKLKDQLGFERDYVALASVVAYKDFQPPLAIGLFGNWGSGKSFFMNKLRDQIQKFADSNNDKFCHKIVQINFNSWHYSDSNLWASLITKIFEDLESRGKGDEKKTKELQVLFQNLNSSQELKVETQQQLDKVEREITQLKTQQAQVEKEIVSQTEGLKKVNIIDIAKEVFKNEIVQKEVEKLRSEFDFVKTEDAKQIETTLAELETSGGKLIESVRILYSFRKGNFWVALLVAVGVFAGTSIAISRIEVLKDAFDGMKVIIAPFLAFVSQMYLYLKRAAPDINKLHDRLVSLKKTTEELELKERSKHNIEREEIQAKIQNAQAESNSLKDKIKDLELKRAQAQFEIDNIASGKKLVGFIEGRVSDQRYINSLGIISWIRKDFEDLDFLLKQQYDAKRLKELKREKIENVFEVDRIILYIDDLDRCDVSVVVKVLEAIHLLLAFPLFVVVVGVDPRWMHNAIQLKYKGFIANGPTNGGDGAVNDLNENGDILKWAQLRSATSFDYLEKIFQIPFALKPISTAGKKKLIAANLKGDNYEKEEESNNSNNGSKNDSMNEKQEDNSGQSKLSNDIDANIGNERNDLTNGKNVVDAKDPQGNEANKESNMMHRSAELLEVPDDEIKLMQELSFIVGDSPRGVKRFTNIYRIIRAHSSFQFVDDKKSEHYYAAMILLGVLSNFPDIANRFFKSLIEENDVTPFYRFFQHYMREHAEFFPVKLLNEMETPELRQVIRNIPVQKFKINLELVCRFSFRDISEDNSEPSSSTFSSTVKVESSAAEGVGLEKGQE